MANIAKCAARLLMQTPVFPAFAAYKKPEKRYVLLYKPAGSLRRTTIPQNQCSTLYPKTHCSATRLFISSMASL
jgi:hypothetical protein